MARQLQESISEVSNSVYYVFAGNHVPRDTLDVPEITLDLDNIQYSPYRNMQFGKRVSANDASLVIRNVPYESNTVYAMYDDDAVGLLSDDYYAIVNASSFYHIYKCLDNNRGAASTVEPNFAHISGSNTSVYQTSDGYRWKYMCSVASDVKDKFETSDWFPLVANSSVSAAATDGSIDIIKVDGTGSGYHNFLAGTFTSTHIRVGGNPTLYQVANDSIQHTNGYYTGCLMYLTTGSGSGQYAIVEDYYSNSSGSFVTIDNPFTTVPLNGTTWDLNPQVKISGYGKSITNAAARALVNSSSSNSIYRVEVLERGAGYSFSQANVIANSVVGVTSPATVRPIKVPFGGHGYDAASELGVQSIMFSVKFSNTESNTITYTNEFQQIGVIRDPVFSNVEFELQSSNGTFIADEILYKISPIQCSMNASINTTSTTVTSATADFVNQFAAGDCVYFKASNGTSHMLTTVNSVTNSSVMVVSTNGYFACTETFVYKANLSSHGYFNEQPSANIIYVSNVTGVFQSNDFIIGESSGGVATINTVSRSNVMKGFDTFVQMTKMIGTVSSGTFVENEFVYQGASLDTATATGRLHSAIVDGGILTIYITNQTGVFTTGTVIGASSLSVASINAIYIEEINDGSGEILFLENISPVLRQVDETETIQINFEY